MSNSADRQRRDPITWWKRKRKIRMIAAAVAYLTLTLVPLFYYVIVRPRLPERGMYAAMLLAYGCVVTFAPHIWFWIERPKFDRWCEEEIAIKDNPTKKLQEREDYKLHVENARAVWAAVIALFAGVFWKFGAGG